jgi:ComF family protein
VAADLAELLIETWQAAGFTADVIVPAPLHPRRWRERGYNQAELLARPLAAATGVPLALDALRRIRYTTPQVAVAGTQRRANVAGAFAGEAAVLAGRRVALVDDVMTTGATLNACADACRVAGATAVLALTVARGL